MRLSSGTATAGYGDASATGTKTPATYQSITKDYVSTTCSEGAHLPFLIWSSCFPQRVLLPILVVQHVSEVGIPVNQDCRED